MTRKSISILLGAVAIVALSAVLLFSAISGSDSTAQHTMPGGQTMDDSVMTTTTGTNHTMTDGTTMSGSEMDMP